MDFQTIFSVAIVSLVVFVIAHFVVFWVVKTMYPTVPAPAPPTVTFSPEPPQVFTPPPTDIQHVTLPTYEAPVPAAPANEEGKPRGPPPPESTSIRGESGMAASNTQQ